MKAIMLSIQPYYVFLIIARLMGWDIPQEKTIEVRKDCPKDLAWNRHVHIYCSKNRKSFNRIPKQYQPLMAKFLGKVIGDFVCAHISQLNSYGLDGDDRLKDTTCLDDAEIMDYVGYLDKLFYLWHISDLKIYDTPKELGEFKPNCKHKDCRFCPHVIADDQFPFGVYPIGCGLPSLTRPPQLWCYCEELNE